MDRTQAQRLYLYGYGSYGMNLIHTFPLLGSVFDRDVILVVAHPRGGRWEENGMKTESFEEEEHILTLLLLVPNTLSIVIHFLRSINYF